MVSSSSVPTGYHPSVLVLGELVVVEQVFTDPAEAVRMDTALKEMGYASVINERRGDELPQM